MIPMWQAVLLGLVQGLTEFLPISSSAHLAIVQHLLPGFRQPGLLFDVAVHVGTLVSVVVYFRRDLAGLVRGLWSPPPAGPESWRFAGLLALAMVPTCIIGLVGAKFFAETFESMAWVGWTLIANAGILLAAKRLLSGDRTLPAMRGGDALLIGTAQGLAILPGISRSGSTIVTGLWRGLDPAWAASFSFLLSIPAVVAAAGYEVFSAWRDGVFASPQASGILGTYVAGATVAGVVGYGAIHLVFRSLGRRSFDGYAWYCLILGAAVLFLPA